MKKITAVLLTVIVILSCLVCSAGCTDEGRLKAKQALCSHKWKEIRRAEGDCLHSYNEITYECTKCEKEKKENVKLSMQEISLLHDWQTYRTEDGVDCQHQDLLIKECSVCKLQSTDILDTCGPHVDNGSGRCSLCGASINN